MDVLFQNPNRAVYGNAPKFIHFITVSLLQYGCVKVIGVLKLC